MKATDESMMLTTSSVANLLGVHPSTIKRWADDGTLASEKTEGGHRRIHLMAALKASGEKEIETFLDPFDPWQANVWIAFTQAAQRQSFRRLQSLALGWLARGETDLVGRLFFEIGNRPEVPFGIFLDEGIRGFMARVGEEWRAGRLQVGEEHMATQVILEALLRLRPGWERLDSPSRQPGEPLPVAVVGAMEGDEHDLGAQAVRILLERDGWRVYFLGANVPLEDFVAVQRAQVAQLVCVSFSPKNALPDLQRAVRVLEEFYRPNYPYALALGGALSEDIAPGKFQEGPFQALSFFRSASDFQLWAGSLRDRLSGA
jgi:excisionase family DNA binding protein